MEFELEDFAKDLNDSGSAEDFNKSVELQENIGKLEAEVERAQDPAEKAQKTAELQKVKDQLQQAVVDGIQKIQEKISGKAIDEKTAKQMLNLLNDFQSTIKNPTPADLQRLQTQAAVISPDLTKTFGQIGDAFQKAADLVKEDPKLQGEIQDFVDGKITDLTDGMKKMYEQIKGPTFTVENAKDFFKKFGDILSFLAKLGIVISGFAVFFVIMKKKADSDTGCYLNNTQISKNDPNCGGCNNQDGSCTKNPETGKSYCGMATQQGIQKECTKASDVCSCQKFDIWGEIGKTFNDVANTIGDTATDLFDILNALLKGLANSGPYIIGIIVIIIVFIGLKFVFAAGKSAFSSEKSE